MGWDRRSDEGKSSSRQTYIARHFDNFLADMVGYVFL